MATLTNSFVEEIEYFGQLRPAKLVFGFGNDVIDSSRSEVLQSVSGSCWKIWGSRGMGMGMGIVWGSDGNEHGFPAACVLLNMFPLGDG